MSEEIKDTLWGAAAAAGVMVLLQIFGLLNPLLVVLIVPAAITGYVSSSYLRDKRISVEYERKLNARYEEAERYINAKPKVDTSEDSEEAERHATLGGSDATDSQPSGTELWQAQAKKNTSRRKQSFVLKRISTRQWFALGIGQLRNPPVDRAFEQI